MPRPVDAFPCGSRSTKRTFWPTAARAVARLIAVVVLRTAPLWLATAIIRTECGLPAGGAGSDTCEVGRAKERAGRSGPAREGFHAQCARARRVGQVICRLGAHE